MATITRFDARSKKIIIEIDATPEAFNNAPVSQKGAGPNKLLASGGEKFHVTVPGQKTVVVATNAYFPKD